MLKQAHVVHFSIAHYKTPPLQNLCLKLCHVYVPEWRPRLRLFFFLKHNFFKKKHSGCTLHAETMSGHVNLFCSVIVHNCIYYSPAWHNTSFPDSCQSNVVGFCSQFTLGKWESYIVYSCTGWSWCRIQFHIHLLAWERMQVETYFFFSRHYYRSIIMVCDSFCPPVHVSLC